MFRNRLSGRPAAFSLVELLVVIGVIALLIGLLLPVISRAQAQARAVKCLSNLRQIGMGLVMYSTRNRGNVIPSYNLPPLPGSTTNFKGGPQQPLDGWACILDRDGLVPSKEQDTNTIFFCPDTVDVEGMKDGQTGNDPAKPRGWTDWPLVFTAVGGDSSPKVAVTIPSRGFNKIIRVSYWINAYNPIGNAPASIDAADVHYTASVGVGPDSHGKYIQLHKTTNIRRSSGLIVLADGIYMGRQSVTRLGDTNSRIGYRHRGMGRKLGAANIAFADGHAETITGDRFPRAIGGSVTLQTAREDNLGGNPTIYADPDRSLTH